VPKLVEFILLVWHLVAYMLSPGDKSQTEGLSARGA